MKIEHAALYVNDLEKARSFFVNYLGAESNDGYHNPRTGFRSYFLSFDGSARLEIMNKPELADSPKEPARTGYAHIAFSTGSMEAVDALTARLKADGYDGVYTLEFYGASSALECLWHSVEWLNSQL